jgi:hypothetical protein
MYSYSRSLRAALLGSALSLAPILCVAAATAAEPNKDAPIATAAAAPSGSAASGATDKSDPNVTTLEAIVVTGVPTAGGRKKLETSYSEVTLSQETIKESNATDFGDLMKLSPGVYVESSGGPTGNNIEVAGFPGSGQLAFGSFELNGVPIYPTSVQTNLDLTSLFQVDDSMDRLEIVQGGPSILYGVGAPALTANYILKHGTDTLAGDAAVSYGSEGNVRFDGFVGLPVDSKDGIYGSIGGFFNSDYNTVRNPQFESLPGGQVTATLYKDWKDGSLLLYAHYLAYDSQFSVDTPLINPAVGVFKQYPGFSPLTGSLESKADQYEQIQVSPCKGTGCTPGVQPVNLANGRGPSFYSIGGEYNWNFGNGLQLRDDFGYTDGKVHMNAFYSTSSTTAGQNPETLAAYIAYEAKADKLPSNVTPYAYYTGTGAAVPLTQDVLTEELRYLDEGFWSVSNEAHLSGQLFAGNTLTAGNYVALYGVNELEYTGSDLLLQAQNNPQPIAISLTSGANTYQLTSSEGFSGAPQKAITNYSTALKYAFFLSDTWKVDKFLFDAGVRVDHESFVDHFGNTAKGSLSGNPFQLYNASAQYLTGSVTDVPYSATAFTWTVGGNYEIYKDMSVYARINTGAHLAAFSEISTGTPKIPIQKNTNFEVGYKYSSPWLYLDVNGFHREFTGVTESGTFVINGASQTETLIYGTRSTGMGWQALATPFAQTGGWLKDFSLQTNGDYVVQYYTNTGCVTYQDINNNVQTVCNASINANGDQLARQPVFQIRATPSYRVPTNWGFVKGWATFEYVGQHYGDMYEQQDLSTYYDFSAGITGAVHNWEWTIRGTNIFNQIGLTEGNSRDSAASITTNSIILARSILGREVTFQIKRKF